MGSGAKKDPRTTLDAGPADPEAIARLTPALYDELRRLAANYFRRQRPGHTLQPTALVHEAYLRLAGSRKPNWSTRTHCFAVAARAMRQVLIDHARRRRAAKRGGAGARVSLEGAEKGEEERDLSDLTEALERLSQLNHRHYEVVTLRFFAGLTTREAAHVLGLSTRTVEDDWRMARAWLFSQLEDRD